MSYKSFFTMEIQSPFTMTTGLLFFFLLLITTVITFLIKKPRRNGCSSKLPPGPWKLPLIGNLHQLILSDPMQVLSDLAREYGPIMHLKVGQISAVVISSPRLAREVLKTQEVAFLDRPQLRVARILFYNGSDLGFAPYGDYWRQMRKICALELLGSKVVKSFASIRENELLDLMRVIRSSDGSSINLSSRIYLHTNAILCRAAFGEKFDRREELVAMLQYQTDAVINTILSDVFPSLSFLLLSNRKLEKMQKKVDSVLQGLINERRQNWLSAAKHDQVEEEEENLLDVLIRLQQEKGGGLQFPIEDAHIKANIFQMFIGGTDTVSTITEWAFSEMVKNPQTMRKAQDELRRKVIKDVAKDEKFIIREADLKGLNYLKMVIRETLRLHPPALLMPRQCRETCEIGGYTIPIKTKVLVNAWALGRDPDYWDDPESFMPERFEDSSCTNYTPTDHFEFIPFGAGRRICPGISFSLPVIELTLANLLYHFNWKLTSATEDMNEISSSARRTKNLHAIPMSTINY